MEKVLEQVSSDQPYQSFRMYDASDDGKLILAGFTYLETMFDIEVTNEKGKPVRIVLTEKPDSFAASETTS